MNISIFILTMKRSELKILIKEILTEWRGATSGEWIEPNGTPHELGHTQDMSDHHYDWAEKYLKIHGPHRFKDDPREELIARGWARVVYSPNDYVIMVMVGHRNYRYLTKAQRIYLEDQSEELQWNIVDDELNLIYEPFDTKTPKSDVRESSSMVSAISNNQRFCGSTALGGYSHGIMNTEPIVSPRDPLTDPLLTGKKPFRETSLDNRTVKDGGYTFRIFSSDAKGDGFDYPIDVNYGTIYLGELRAMSDGYIVRKIDTPQKERYVSYTGLPPYKTMLVAAKVLHQIWSAYRKN